MTLLNRYLKNVEDLNSNIFKYFTYSNLKRVELNLNKKKQKVTIFLATFLMCSLTVAIWGTNISFSTTSFGSNKPFDITSLKMAIVYPDLIIDDTGGQNWAWAKTSGICTGSGTSGDPYKIQNQIFEYGIALGDSLQILNSRKYFELIN